MRVSSNRPNHRSESEPQNSPWAALGSGRGASRSFKTAGKIPCQSWNRCAWFNNELDDTDQKIFYFDLWNKEFYWEAGGDHQPANDSADDVDLLFVNTHGGVDFSAFYTMKNQNLYADSVDMRLGDSAWWGGGLAILATYACHTLKDDGSLISRWAPALAGGLKMVLGSHDTVWSGTTTNEIGEDFADYMQQSKSIKLAWRDGLEDAFTDQDVSVFATGTNSSNCASRRDNIKWQNFGTYAFLRDGSIGYYCNYWWNNL